MSKRLEMEQKRIERQIRLYGNTFIVERKILDKYGEDTGETEIVANIDGLFHTTKGYTLQSVGDSTRVHKKGQPMILTILDNVDIKTNDIVEVNGNKYTITDIENIEQFNIVYNISLELIIDGI